MHVTEHGLHVLPRHTTRGQASQNGADRVRRQWLDNFLLHPFHLLTGALARVVHPPPKEEEAEGRRWV